MSDWKSTQIVMGDIGKKMVRSTVTMLTLLKNSKLIVFIHRTWGVNGPPLWQPLFGNTQGLQRTIWCFVPRLVVKKNTGKLEGQLVENSWWLRREEIHEKKQEPGSLECISYSRRLASSWACAICWVCWEKKCDNGNWCIWMYLGATGATNHNYRSYALWDSPLAE